MCSTNTTTQPQPKKQKLVGYIPAKAMFTPKDTWTHDFCVLAKQDESVTPARARLNTLLDAGLGKARLSMKKLASHEEFKCALEEKFTKLKDAGGFEVLRAEGGGGGQRSLVVVHPGAFGYTAPHLKERMAQALIYIRPLQIDLDEQPLVPKEGLSPKVKCLNCGNSVIMSAMRDHQQSCQGGSSGSSGNAIDNDDATKKEPWTVLCDVFPGYSSEHYKSVWESTGGDVAKAVAKMGGWADEDFSIEDDELEELPSVTEIFQQGAPQKGKTAVCPADIITTYRNQVARQGAYQYIQINRMHLSLMQQLMRIYKDPTLDMKKPLNVNFVGEQGADVGGPTKEFFHEAISVLSKVDPVYNIQLFGGTEGHQIPLYGVDAISSGCFKMAGQLVAHSLLHGGPGFGGLSPAVIKYITTGSVEKAKDFISIKDLYDVELQEILETQFQDDIQIKDIDRDTRGKVEDMLVKHGLSDTVPLTDVNKDKAIKDLLTAEVLITRTLALDRFFLGLNVHGLGDLLRKHPCLSPHVLPTLEEAKIDVVLFKEKLVFQLEHSDEKEEKVKSWFLQFVDETALSTGDGAEGLLSFLLLFITGSTLMDAKLKMDVIYQTSGGKSLLEADSCFNRLIIPVCHESYNKFKEACCLSLKAAALGYGRF